MAQGLGEVSAQTLECAGVDVLVAAVERVDPLGQGDVRRHELGAGGVLAQNQRHDGPIPQDAVEHHRVGGPERRLQGLQVVRSREHERRPRHRVALDLRDEDPTRLPRGVSPSHEYPGVDYPSQEAQVSQSRDPRATTARLPIAGR